MVFAQVNELNAVDVVAGAIRLPEVAQSIHVFDSLQIQRQSFLSADKLIQQNPSFFGRSYGPGMATTPTYRGYNASQFNQYWNGVLLNSPGLGLFDISAWTISVGDQFRIESGAGAIQFGSGYMGGGMYLDRQWSDTITQVELESKIGSFGFLGNRVNAQYHTGKFSFRTVIDRVSAKNNYTYQSYTGAELERLGANYDQLAVQQYARYRWSDHQRTEFGYWGQKIDRQIPNSITGPYRVGAAQKDDYHRMYLRHIVEGKVHSFTFSEAFTHESMRYIDATILANDTNLAMNLITDANWKFRMNTRLELSSGVRYALQSVGGSTKLEADRSQWGLYSHLTWFTPWGTGRFGIRGERTSQVWAPIIPSLEWKLPIGQSLAVKAYYTANYRFPTLNDLYYSPGGYPNLLPENGFMYGGSVIWSPLRTLKNLIFEVETYKGSTQNYIQWIQVGSYWSPRNIKEVDQWGLEGEMKYSFKVFRFDMSMRTGYAFTHTEVVKSVQNNDPSVGKPLIYIPKHRFTSGVNILYSRWSFGWNYQYTGEVYASPNPTAASTIEAYSIHDLYLGYRYRLKAFYVDLSGGINNVMDVNYETQKNYPMPGRSYYVSMRIGFNN